jgi:Ca2+-binding RTX toxin-like protein
VVRGGTGDDFVDGNSGPGDRLEGGDGSDTLECEGDPGEVYDGGPGFDGIECVGSEDELSASRSGVTPNFSPEDFVIDLASGVVRGTTEGETVSTALSIEDAAGGPGNDTLLGTDGANALRGGGGNDSIDGRGGSDQLSGGGGGDTIQSNDAQSDRVDGGEDSDTCSTDQPDDVLSCEALSVAAVAGPPAGAPPADHTGPGCRVSAAAGNFTKGQVTFSATCNEGGTLAAEIVARLKKLPRGFRFARTGDVILGSKSAKVSAGRRVKLTLKLSKRYKRGLRKRGTVRVVLHATDALGNQSALTKAVRLK